MLSKEHPLYVSLLLLREIFRHANPRSHVEFRFIKRDGHVKSEWIVVETLEEEFEYMAGRVQKMNADGYDCYFGVNPRLVRPATGAGTNDLVSESGCAWLDIDRPDALEVLNPAVPPPSCIIMTGTVGHAQAYWFFGKSIPIETAVAFTEKLAGLYHGDNTCDPARIFRLPGTLNLKHPEGQPCEMVGIDSDAIVDDVDEQLEAMSSRPLTVEGLLRSGKLDTGTVELIRKGYAVAPIDPSKGRVDRSDVDFRVMSALFVAGVSEEMIRMIFTDPMYKISEKYFSDEKKGNGSHYLEQSLSAARANSDSEINRAITQDKELVLFRMSRLCAAPPVSWLVRPIIAMNSLTVVAGEQKVGKSLGVLDLALMLAAGHHEKWLDRYEVACQKRVLICTSETGESTLRARVASIAHSRGIDWIGLEDHLFYQHVPFTVTNFEIQNALMRALKKHHIEVLIVDPLNRYHLSNENDAKDMTMMLQGLDRVAKGAGVVSTILVHHFNKPQGDSPRVGAHNLRGSTVLASWGSTYVLCSRRESFGGKTYVRFSFELREAETPTPFSMELDTTTLRFRDYSVDTERVLQTLNLVKQLPSSSEDELTDRLRENKVVHNKSEAQKLIQRAKAIMLDQKAVEEGLPVDPGAPEAHGPDIG